MPSELRMCLTIQFYFKLNDIEFIFLIILTIQKIQPRVSTVSNYKICLLVIATEYVLVPKGQFKLFGFFFFYIQSCKKVELLTLSFTNIL